MEFIIFGFCWFTWIFLVKRQLNNSSRALQLISMIAISLYLFLTKSYEYGIHWIDGDYSKMPVEYSAITYFLFSITILLNIKILKPFVTFAAILSGLGYLLVFPFLGAQFIEGNGLLTTFLALLNHSLLFLAGMLQMSMLTIHIKERKTIYRVTLVMILYSIIMQYIFNFNGKYLFIYMVLDGRVLNAISTFIQIDGMAYLLYFLVLIVLYTSIVKLFIYYNLYMQKHTSRDKRKLEFLKREVKIWIFNTKKVYLIC